MKNRIRFRHKAFEHVNPLDYWRFVIDVKIQLNTEEELGWLRYNNSEPGSVKALLRAYEYMADTVNEKVTPAYIKKLHNLALGTVYLSARNRREILVGEFRKEAVLFGVTRGSNATNEGMYELYHGIPQVDYSLQHDSGPWDGRPQEDARYYMVRPTTHGQDNINTAVQQILDTYYKKMEQLNEKKLSDNETKDAKLETIIECIKNLELTHPFSDGNCRVFCIVLFHKLLLENDFPPAILFDPNRIEGYTVTQLMEEARTGMRLYEQNFKETKPTTSEIIKEQVEQWEQEKYRDIHFKVAPLHSAVELGIPEIVENTVIQVKKINEKDENGKTALMLAAARGDVEIVNILLKHPHINVNEEDQFGYTAAKWAAEAGYSEVASLLLNHAKENKESDKKNDLTSGSTLEKLLVLPRKKWAIVNQDLTFEELDLLNEFHNVIKSISLETLNLQDSLLIYAMLKNFPAVFVEKQSLLTEIKNKITTFDPKTSSVLPQLSTQALNFITTDIVKDFSNQDEISSFIRDAKRTKILFSEEFNRNAYYFSNKMSERGEFKDPKEALSYVRAHPEIIAELNRGTSYSGPHYFAKRLAYIFEDDENKAADFIFARPRMLAQCLGNLNDAIYSTFHDASPYIEKKFIETILNSKTLLPQINEYKFKRFIEKISDPLLIKQAAESIPFCHREVQLWFANPENTSSIKKIFKCDSPDKMMNVFNSKNDDELQHFQINSMINSKELLTTVKPVDLKNILYSTRDLNLVKKLADAIPLCHAETQAWFSDPQNTDDILRPFRCDTEQKMMAIFNCKDVEEFKKKYSRDVTKEIKKADAEIISIPSTNSIFTQAPSRQQPNVSRNIPQERSTSKYVRRRR